jgi:hypothetical protein
MESGKKEQVMHGVAAPRKVGTALHALGSRLHAASLPTGLPRVEFVDRVLSLSLTS